MTVETYNGTPAQSQVERDKTVATNESSSEEKGGVEFPWRKENHFAKLLNNPEALSLLKAIANKMWLTKILYLVEAQ